MKAWKNKINVSITPARESDMPEVEALARKIWPVSYKGIISTEQIEYMLDKMYSHEVVRDEFINCGVKFDFLIINGEKSGYVSYEYCNKNTVRLHKIYILPSIHGKGYGSMLLKHVQHKTIESDHKQLLLNVNKKNINAIHAYERNGFRKIKSVVNEFGGGFVMDDYLMEWVTPT